MKKEIFTHFIYFSALFVFISVLRNFFSLPYIYFWIGGIIGTLLPDLDHFIYIYYLRPHELTSQRVQNMVNRGQLKLSLSLLALTRSERKHLIFHTFTFQTALIIFSFLVITSSGSLLGRGLVVAFMLHLLVDQFIDLISLGNINNWFTQLNIYLSYEKTSFYLLFQIVILFIFSFLF